MLIGCLDGRVHKWEVGGATKDLLHLEGSVLHMQFDHQLEVSTCTYTPHSHTEIDISLL